MAVDQGLLRLPMPGGGDDLAGLTVGLARPTDERPSGADRAARQRSDRRAVRLLIGSVLPLTGPARGDGLEMRNGTALAIDEINARGGVAGRRLEHVVVPADIFDAVERSGGLRRADRRRGRRDHQPVRLLRGRGDRSRHRTTAPRSCMRWPPSTWPSRRRDDPGRYSQRLPGLPLGGALRPRLRALPRRPQLERLVAPPPPQRAVHRDAAREQPDGNARHAGAGRSVRVAGRRRASRGGEGRRLGRRRRRDPPHRSRTRSSSPTSSPTSSRGSSARSRPRRRTRSCTPCTHRPCRSSWSSRAGRPRACCGRR